MHQRYFFEIQTSTKGLQSFSTQTTSASDGKFCRLRGNTLVVLESLRNFKTKYFSKIKFKKVYLQMS
jgi:hypothetical protein